MFQFLDWCLYRLATRPFGGRGGTRTHNHSVLVTSVRLRGVKVKALREWKAVFSVLETVAFPVGYSPIWRARQDSNLHGLLVTPGRLRNAK